MRDLTLVGLSDDRSRLVLSDEDGREYGVPTDELHASLRNDRARLGQVEANMGNALRPRDIQDRIRRGESPESVAASGDVPLERVMTYAVPVLAEREHMCQRARAGAVRRRTAASGGLGDAVDAGLLAAGRSLDDAPWDSWRRDDGRWMITVAGEDDGEPAQFVFDPPGRFAVPDNEAARRLVADVEPAVDATDMAIAAAVSAPAVPVAEEAYDVDEPGVTSLKRARARRAMTQDQLTLDAGPLGADPLGVHATDQVPAGAGGTGAPFSAGDGAAGDKDTEQTVDLDETAEQIRATRTTGDPVADAAAAADADAGRSRKRRDRRRVPSWDEIMFGGAERDR